MTTYSKEVVQASLVEELSQSKPSFRKVQPWLIDLGWKIAETNQTPIRGEILQIICTPNMVEALAAVGTPILSSRTIVKASAYERNVDYFAIPYDFEDYLRPKLLKSTSYGINTMTQVPLKAEDAILMDWTGDSTITDSGAVDPLLSEKGDKKLFDLIVKNPTSLRKVVSRLRSHHGWSVVNGGEDPRWPSAFTIFRGGFDKNRLGMRENADYFCTKEGLKRYIRALFDLEDENDTNDRVVATSGHKQGHKQASKRARHNEDDQSVDSDTSSIVFMPPRQHINLAPAADAAATSAAVRNHAPSSSSSTSLTSQHSPQMMVINIKCPCCNTAGQVKVEVNFPSR